MIERASHWAPILMLAPLLVAQGVYVRRATPRLPEPPGPREGEAGVSGPLLRLLIVGDSAAAGVGASAQAHALSGRLIDELQRDHRVSWRLLAQSGVDARGLAALLRDSTAASYDVAVVSIGVNDVTGRVGLVQWRRHLDEIVALLRLRFEIGHILFSPLPPMHRFSALPQPLRWALGRRARRFDRALSAWVGTQARCQHLRFEFPLQREMLAADGFHPGEPAYLAWAAAVASEVRRQPRGV